VVASYIEGKEENVESRGLPQLRELRIIVEDMMCVPVWEKLPGYTSIDLRPERVEVVLGMAVATFCYCNEHEIEPPDCGGFVRNVSLGMVRTRATGEKLPPLAMPLEVSTTQQPHLLP
jgi:hypothetical protein